MSQPRENLEKHSEGGTSKGTRAEVGMRWEPRQGSVHQAGECQGCGLCIKSHRNHGMDAKMQGTLLKASFAGKCGQAPPGNL